MDGGTSDPEGSSFDLVIKLHSDIHKSDCPSPLLIFYFYIFGINWNLSDEPSLTVLRLAVWSAKPWNFSASHLQLRRFGVFLSRFDICCITIKTSWVKNTNYLKKCFYDRNFT